MKTVLKLPFLTQVPGRGGDEPGHFEPGDPRTSASGGARAAEADSGLPDRASAARASSSVPDAAHGHWVARQGRRVTTPQRLQPHCTCENDYIVMSECVGVYKWSDVPPLSMAYRRVLPLFCLYIHTCDTCRESTLSGLYQALTDECLKVIENFEWICDSLGPVLVIDSVTIKLVSDLMQVISSNSCIRQFTCNYWSAIGQFSSFSFWYLTSVFPGIQKIETAL